MEFTMSAMLSIGSQPNGDASHETTAPIHGFTYAEESDDGVNWHISEFFTDEGASWSCLLPDIAIIEGVLFAACYIADDAEADAALTMIAEVINGDKEYDESIGERAIAAATAIAAKYHWTLTRWPNCEFFFSQLLVSFPDDTLYFLNALDE
jgi:hypothetical protein